MNLRALACLAVLLAGVVAPLPGAAAPAAHHHHEALSPPTESSANKTLAKGSFTDQHGQTVTLPDGRLWVVAFFYGSCQTVCPRILFNVNELAKRLPEAAQSKVAFAAISFDPTRDTPVQLPALAQRHDVSGPNVYLLSGSADTTRQVIEATGFDFKPDGEGGYRHVNMLAVIDGQGRILHHFYGLEPNLDQIAHLIQHS